GGMLRGPVARRGKFHPLTVRDAPEQRLPRLQHGVPRHGGKARLSPPPPGHIDHPPAALSRALDGRFPHADCPLRRGRGLADRGLVFHCKRRKNRGRGRRRDARGGTSPRPGRMRALPTLWRNCGGRGCRGRGGARAARRRGRSGLGAGAPAGGGPPPTAPPPPFGAPGPPPPARRRPPARAPPPPPPP